MNVRAARRPRAAATLLGPAGLAVQSHSAWPAARGKAPALYLGRRARRPCRTRRAPSTSCSPSSTAAASTEAVAEEVAEAKVGAAPTPPEPRAQGARTRENACAREHARARARACAHARASTRVPVRVATRASESERSSERGIERGIERARVRMVCACMRIARAPNTDFAQAAASVAVDSTVASSLVADSAAALVSAPGPARASAAGSAASARAALAAFTRPSAPAAAAAASGAHACCSAVRRHPRGCARPPGRGGATV